MSIVHTRCWDTRRPPKRRNNYVTNDGSAKNNVVLKQGAGQVQTAIKRFPRTCKATRAEFILRDYVALPPRTGKHIPAFHQAGLAFEAQVLAIRPRGHPDTSDTAPGSSAFFPAIFCVYSNRPKHVNYLPDAPERTKQK